MNDRETFVLTQEGRPAPLNVLDEAITVLADVERTGTYEIFLQAGPEGAGPPPHTHDWDESFYVVRGSVEVIVDGRGQTATAGALVYIPGGTTHSFRIGEGGVEMLSINSHGGAAAMFTEIDARMGPAVPDVPALVGILTSHGLTMQVPDGGEDPAAPVAARIRRAARDSAAHDVGLRVGPASADAANAAQVARPSRPRPSHGAH